MNIDSSKKQPILFENLEYAHNDSGTIIFNKLSFLSSLKELYALTDFSFLKKTILLWAQTISNIKDDEACFSNISSPVDTIIIPEDILLSQLQQIAESQTITRAKYYLKRLIKGVEVVRTNKVNDINLNRWQEYDDIITDSLWVFNKRSTSGSHIGWYWGNFVPQIPHQMLLRFTKKDDWVLDTFVGSGTTLIECKRLGRNGIGIELVPEVADEARKLVQKESDTYGVTTDIINEDSRTINYEELLRNRGLKQVQLLIMHPPYHDIIKFSEDPNDLSNASSVDEFLRLFSEVVSNSTPFLQSGRYLAIVIGDKYSKGELIPLGALVINAISSLDQYTLKSVIVKNFEETRAKRNQKELWRYRALVGGFYVFKHEYILLFQKRKVI